MENSTKKAIMLGVLLLGCGLTSLLGSFLGNSNKVNLLTEAQLLQRGNSDYVSAKDPFAKKNKQQSTMLKIYVSGAVLQPGLYDVPQGARADDAVKAAGGMLEQADPQRVNLARKLKDGMQVNVPFAKRKSGYSSGNYAGTSNVQNFEGIQGFSNKSDKLVNLNTASAEELESLPGIGASMAQRIIDYRQRNSFHRVEDLVKVPGIGKAKLKNLRGKICV